MTTVLIIIGMIAVALLAMFVYPQWRLKRNIPKVIRIFRERSAIGIKNAKTIDELRLRPRGMMQQMFRRRDYKQYALTALMRADIIQMTEDERLYLSEEKLSESRFGSPTPYFH